MATPNTFSSTELSLYNRACVKLVMDVGAQSQRTQAARNAVALCLRTLRASGKRDLATRATWHFSHVGWPVRQRPNGRYV